MKRATNVATLIFILFCSLHAFGAANEDLHTFMEGILVKSSSQALPSALEMAQVFDAIPAMTGAKLQEAIPSIMEALNRENSDVRRIAIIAVYCIDQRPGSEIVIDPLIPSLLALLNDPDPELVALAVRSISSAKPRPPHSVVQPYVGYLSRVSPPNAASATIVFSLVRIAPTDASVSNAIVEVLRSQAMSDNVRVAVLNAVAYPSNISDQVIVQIASDLSSSRSEEIRLTAIRALQVIGPKAIRIASIPLSEISDGESETTTLRNAAKSALKTAHASN